MRITDVDLWTGGYDRLRRRACEDSLIRMMEQTGISNAVVRHDRARFDPKTGNALAKELCAAHPGKFRPSVILDPVLGKENIAGEGSLTERLRAYAPAALAVYPEEKRVVFSPFYWEEILDAANALSLPLFVFQTYGNDFFRHLPETAADYPAVKFILTRYGCTGSRTIFPLLEKTRNVYFTVSHMLDYLQIEEICARGGAGRILFGSAYPDFSPAGPLGLIAYAEISEKEKQMIFSENWEAISV